MSFYALLGVVAYLEFQKHFATRYRMFDLRQPWTFRERLREAASRWWVGPCMLTGITAIALIGVYAYGTVIGPAFSPLGILATAAPWYGFLLLATVVRGFGKELDYMREISQSFEQVVTRELTSSSASSRATPGPSTNEARQGWVPPEPSEAPSATGAFCRLHQAHAQPSSERQD